VSSDSGTLTERKSERRNRSSDGHQLDAEFAGERFIGKRIVGQQVHPKGGGQAEYFGADIAHAELAERLADEAGAHELAAARPARGPLAAQPVFDQELLRQGEHEGDDRDGHGPAHPVGRDDERNGVVGAGVHIDAVVADAEAGDEAERVAGRDRGGGEAGHQQDQPVAAG
jgi:hypothetical protein